MIFEIFINFEMFSYLMSNLERFIALRQLKLVLRFNFNNIFNQLLDCLFHKNLLFESNSLSNAF